MSYFFSIRGIDLTNQRQTVDYHQCPNLIKDLPEANVWSINITYLKLSNGEWAYLSATLDLRTHKNIRQLNQCYDGYQIGSFNIAKSAINS